MAINSCSSTSNLATQYAEQLQASPVERLDKTDPNAPIESNPATQATGPTLNGQGEVVGTLFSAIA